MSSVAVLAVSQINPEGQRDITSEGVQGFITQEEHARLLERLKYAEERACLSEENLQRAMDDMHSIR